ncbi:MAG: hypothetical protein MJ174_03470 [Treponema sp.]|nr:hypothetical protein [Treponema sp.]
MKKITKSLLLTFALSLCFGLSSCSKKDSVQEVASTPAGILCQQFKSIVKANDSISMEDLANQIVANEIIPFGPAVMPVEEGYLNGFTDEINGFSEAAVFGPMIGSIPFVGYVFRTDDVNALMETLKEKADLRWNVCTQADEIVCDSVNKIVFFVMAPKSFDEPDEF